MFFRIGHVYVISFDMIALTVLQLIVMSYFIQRPMKPVQNDEQGLLSRKCLERGKVCHIINLYIIHT